MTEPRPDDERLSALLDGRLEGREREELLAHLAANDEDFQVLADAADILLQAEAAEANEQQIAAGEAMVPPSMRADPRNRWRRTLRAIVPAILVGFAALGAWMIWGRTGMADPVELAAGLEGGRPQDSLDGSWFEYRGGQEDAQERAIKAAQAGALLVHLSLAVQAGDEQLTKQLAGQIRLGFDAQAVEASPIYQLELRAGEPADVLRPLVEEETGRLEDALGRGHLRLGAWTETALLAVGKQDEAFFRSRDTRNALRRAERVTRGDPDAQRAVSAVRAAVVEQDPPDWNTAKERLEALVRALTS